MKSLKLDPVLENQVNKVKVAHASRHRKRSAETLVTPVVRLPVWSDAHRASPNALVRGALFSAVQSRQRKTYATATRIVSVQGMTVKYTGEQLDQADLDVWLQCVHLARSQPLGEYIYTTARQFLLGLGHGTGGSAHQWLKAIFKRLTFCMVDVSTAGTSYYVGNLIHTAACDGRNGRLRILINRDLMGLFESGWTSLVAEHRIALRCKPLALWLYGFYASHMRPYPVKIVTLHAMCGSDNKQMPVFRRQVGIALTELQTLGMLTDFSIEKGRVSVIKNPEFGV